jgi:CBS domain-containing protein
MRANDIMTPHPACCTPDDTIADAARLMSRNDCGCIPVVEASGNNVVGVVTDRDIVIRGVRHGRSSSTPVSEVMTPTIHTCAESATVDDIEAIMTDRQIRRVVVVDDGGACVGIVSQADLARAAEHRRGVREKDVAHVLEAISEPRSSASFLL